MIYFIYFVNTQYFKLEVFLHKRPLRIKMEKENQDWVNRE